MNLNFSKFLINKYRPYKYIVNKSFSKKVAPFKKKIIATGNVLNTPEELSNKPNFSTENDHLSNNLYLQILSCLNKLNIWNEEEKEEKTKKLNYFLSQYTNGNNKIKINDEELLKLISSSSLSNSEDKKLEDLFTHIDKIINEELSEEEFAEKNDNSFRFVRPPHTKLELKKVLEEADTIYEENKHILLQNDNKTKTELKEKFIQRFPNYFLMRNLAYNDSEILLIGVQRNSNLHADFLSEILDKYSPDLISLQLHPDHPLFINAEGNCKEDWKGFLKKNEEFNFLINPRPQNVNDLIISAKKIEKMFDVNFALCKDIQISSKIMFSLQKSQIIRKQEYNHADTLLTPFIYSFHSRMDDYAPILISDYPLIQHLEDIVANTSLDNLKLIFQKVLQELQSQNYFFSYELFSKEIFLNTRLAYSAELLRQSCYSNKRILFVLNYHHIDPFIEKWKKIPQKIQPLENHFKYNNEDINFMDFTEKLVIADILNGSFLNDYFIKYKSFPYPCREHVTWINNYGNIFISWEHYYKHYIDLIEKVPFSANRYNEFLNKFNVGIQDEIDEVQLEKKLIRDIEDELTK